MITVINEQLSTHEKEYQDDSFSTDNTPPNNTSTLANTAASTDNQLLLPHKFVTHSPKSGLNPLVDAAAYLFSLMGKLKLLKSYRHLSKLRNELTQEINLFQDAAKSLGYNSEYILVSRYALCASLDDIISNTPWGAQGQWDSHNLMSAFNQESITQERFFVILERLVQDPSLYIDVMEFMYICLSLGFKGMYRSTEYNNTQLEQITNALYKRIRAYRGDFSKILSPFPIKVFTAPKVAPTHWPSWIIVLLAVSFSLVLFAGIRYMLNVTSNQAYQDLTRMGKTASYETHDQTTEQ
ncbi:MAG: type IVB secretion system protein IcmH/DotU [Gammaproteobacteria bacterium]|nr:type IVB secretion system protein IcmH/DotU [Gammaproteobacteria bacterium]